MSESPIPVTKDPSLKRYFKFMLTNRKMSVQFTSGKIREIIETDLGIKLPLRKSLYSRVCIEAFAYYMQSWPEWNLAIKSKYSDALYDCLITYLRGKLLSLKDREANYRQSTAENVILNLPENMHISRKKGLKKIRSPYSLKVHVPNNSWKTSDVCLRNYGTNHVYVELKKPKPQEIDMGILETINYPFIHAEIYIPGLIHFTRTTPFRIERYLQTASDDLKDIDIFNNVYAIKNTNAKSPHKAYSLKFMKSLLVSLNQTLLYYKNECEQTHVQTIAILVEQFLADINDAGPQKTVCEGSSVLFNIGKKGYFVDSELSTQNIQNEQLVFKKVITPVVEYDLASCHMTNANINDNGKFDYLDFSDKKDPLKEMQFFNRIKNCLKFKCILCELEFNIVDLKNHMLINHSLETKLKCLKCQKVVRISKLLPKRWRHDCNVTPVANVNNVTI